MYPITRSDIKRICEEDVQKIIEKHFDKPIDKLLYFLRDKNLPGAFIADQIIIRKKAQKKFPTISQKNILFESTAYEQSSSEATAVYKSSLMKGDSLIDLTGGLGIDTLVLSKNFKRIIYSEINPNLVELFRYNSFLDDKKNIETNSGDSIEFLKNWRGKKFDWIYLDPSRRDGSRRSVDLEFCTPNIYDNLELFKKKAENICIKISPAFDFKEANRKLPELTNYIVISVNNECKEVLLLLKNGVDRQEKSAVLLDEFGNISHEFSISISEIFEKKIAENFCRYFYEPDSAIIKAGLTDFISNQFGLSFINNRISYLTSDSIIKNFPGRTFEVLEALDYNPGKLQKYFREKGIKKANISKREFPKSVEEIKKELKLSDGGDNYFFFTKNISDKLLCVITKKL